MMRDCEDGAIRDLLPGYVHGTLSNAERDVVADHLEACEDCTAEAELIRAASTAFPVPTIDVSAIVRALPRAPHVARRGPMGGQLYRIAAGVGAVAIGALSVFALRGVFSKAAPPVGQTATAPQSNPNTAAATPPAQIASAPAPVNPRASTVAPPVAPKRVRSISFGGGLSDLSDEQLDALLGELDGLESLPAEEPETHVVTSVPPDDGGHGAR